MRKIIIPLLLLIASFHLSGCLHKVKVPKVPSPSTIPIEEIHVRVEEKNTVGKHALLIGIENYNHPKITNLDGPSNDVRKSVV